MTQEKENTSALEAPNFSPICPTYKSGHRRNGSSMTAASIKAVAMNGNLIENLLVNLGLRGQTAVDTKKRNFGTLIILLLLLILFIFSFIGFVIMWFTEIYNDSLISNLVYAKNSTAAKWWKTPPLSPQLRVYIFNYTNYDDYINGYADKLILKELGPYIYSENSTKVQVNFNDNNTISYREHRSFEFQPKISNGRQSDQVVVPNVPLFSAIPHIETFNPFFRWGVKLTIQQETEPFRVLPAHDFLWGYDDSLINKIKAFKPMPFENFGMLVTRNGTSQESFTIHSGVGDLKKLNVIDNFNGKPKLDFWSTEECNRIDGTDGSQFPPYLLDKKSQLQVFIKAFCRRFPLAYDSEVNIFDGVPAWRYKAPLNVFGSPQENKENQCYCTKSGDCAPSGVFNATLCFDSPIYASFPHFLSGEASLFKNLEGLNPDPEKHLTYADIHARLAFPLDGASRFQINVQVTKGGLRSLRYFDDNQILPVIWMEITSGEISKELRAMIYHSTFSANAIQLSLRYGTLCLASYSSSYSWSFAM